MRNLLILLAMALAVQPVWPQKPARDTRPAAAKAAPSPTPDPAAEAAQLEEALGKSVPAERAAALQAFLKAYPTSQHGPRAKELLTVARAAAADELYSAGRTAESVAAFELAVREAPQPIPDRLFNEVISRIPADLFFRGERAAGLRIAALIEERSGSRAPQLVALAGFYLAIEAGSEAKRLAERAIEADGSYAAAYQALGMASRLNFEFEETEKAFTKALEIDPTSVQAKRSLAEAKRALGKFEEALDLYRATGDAQNGAPVRTGIILSLFGLGRTAEAETELKKALADNPRNPAMLAEFAYAYAAQGNGARAVELAQKAIEIEPRIVWAHIALARGHMAMGRPVDAERVLVLARRYGNFPTLEYEIASARLEAGFFREAVEELRKSFRQTDAGIETRLGGRIARRGQSFAELIGAERKAAILQPAAADNPETAARLQLLFGVEGLLQAENVDEAEVVSRLRSFVNGSDKMKLHRQLHAATVLLQRRIALAEVLELARAAMQNTEAGLEVSNPSAAVMASELYESRTIAFSRNEMIVVPDVPRQTLLAILRGRIEELSGWTLFQQQAYPEAIVRLRRALSVLPEKSAWWRSATWRLGAALEADGKAKDALEYYARSYKADRPDPLKYSVVENVYRQVHGNTEGLEAMIGPNPMPQAVAAATPAAEPSPSLNVANAVTEKQAASADGQAEKASAPPEEAAKPIENPPAEEVSKPVEKKEDEAPKADEKNETAEPEAAKPAAVPTDDPAKDTAETTGPPDPAPAQTVKTEDAAEPKTTEAKDVEDATKPPENANPETEMATEPPAKAVVEPSNAGTAPAAAKRPRLGVVVEDKLAAPPAKNTTSSRQIFEPVIIRLPAVEANTPKPLSERTAVSTAANALGRPRVVPGAEIRSDCTISVSPSTIDVPAGGGSVAVLVSLSGDGEIKDVTAGSSSPRDIEITTAAAFNDGPRGLFIVRSLTAAGGIYQALFDSPCGRLEAVIRVR